VKGELRPELANLLCWISDPNKKDVFLDPFAGSGAIPIERAKAFPYQKIIASDINADLFDKLKKRFHKTTNKITIGKWDALHLTALIDESIDKIVTDPPWGLFSHQEIDLKAFYTNMLRGNFGYFNCAKRIV
jgi:tRNA G10  N-methylase Trm11